MKSLLPPVFFRSLAIAAACALCAVTAFAQAPAATPAEKPKPLASGDQTYLRNTLKSLNYLLQLGKAGSTLEDESIARLRDTIADGLGKAFEALSKVATAHGEKIVTDITGNNKVDLDRVTKSKPDKLAKEWAAELAKESKHLDHETEVAGKTVQDADLKTFIINYGPSIRVVFTSADGVDKAQKKTK